MNKNTAGALIAVVALLVIAGVVIASQPDNSQAPTGSTGHSSGTKMEESANNESKPRSGAGEEDLTGQTEVAMDIQDFAFAQKSIRISKGTKVTWTNRDDAKHNVVSKEDGGPSSKLLAKGESYEFTFGQTGSFNYICEPHPYMKAAVNVVE